MNNCRIRAIGSIYFITTAFNLLKRMMTLIKSAGGTIHIHSKAARWNEPTVL